MSIQFELLKATSGLTDPFAILGSDNGAMDVDTYIYDIMSRVQKISVTSIHCLFI